MPVLDLNVRGGGSVAIHTHGARPQRPVSVSLPLFVEGVFMPTPDLKDVSNVILGAVKRVINPVPAEFDPKLMERFGNFVRDWVKTNLVPLAADADTSVKTWLESTDYPAWRKQELEIIGSQMDFTEIDAKFFECKSFLKYESYPEYKYPRTINPRPDQFKVFSGPIFKLIEREVFKRPEFIKKVPLDQRAVYIMENVYVPGSKYFVTDYSSFESSFGPMMLENCEMILYEYMSSRLDTGRAWFENVRRALTGSQRLRFGAASVKTRGTRMSGDMCTSLGNGFSNMMLMLFAGREFDLGDMRAVFEGDDGLGCFQRGIPDPAFFNRLGFTVKMEVVTELFEASFCGMVFDPEAMQRMNDPHKFLANLGWTSVQYMGAKRSKLMGLLKAKALSGLYEWKGAPVIPHLCMRIKELTDKYDWRVVYKSRTTSGWMREWYDEISKADLVFEEPKMATRLLFEKRYGISLDVQLKLEERFRTITLGPLDLWEVVFPEIWHDNWRGYVGSPSWLWAKTHGNYMTKRLVHPDVRKLLYQQMEAAARGIRDPEQATAWVLRETDKIERQLAILGTRVD